MWSTHKKSNSKKLVLCEQQYSHEGETMYENYVNSIFIPISKTIRGERVIHLYVRTLVLQRALRGTIRACISIYGRKNFKYPRIIRSCRKKSRKETARNIPSDVSTQKKIDIRAFTDEDKLKNYVCKKKKNRENKQRTS